jgi:hypothetical protein
MFDRLASGFFAWQFMIPASDAARQASSQAIIACAASLAVFAGTLTAQDTAVVARDSLTARDSIRAQGDAYKAIRLSYHATGTVKFRRNLKAKVPVAIADALKVIPGDEWLASARLAWPLPSSPAASAPASLAACGASLWWCELLNALSNVRVANLTRADSLTTSAISHMPADIRCIWDDVSALISDKNARKQYEKMRCEDRFPINDRLWWLADPMHSVAGNERRMDHFARQVNMRLAHETRLSMPNLPPYFRGVPGFPWGLNNLRNSVAQFHHLDTRERALVDGAGGASALNLPGFLETAFRVQRRAEFGTGFEGLDTRIRLSPIARGPRDVPAVAQQYVPDWIAVASPLTARSTDWELDAGYKREMGFSFVGRIIQLDHQHAFFRRGFAAQLVVASDVSAHSELRSAGTNAFLAASPSPDAVPLILPVSGGPRYIFSQLVLPDSTLFSFEVLTRNRGAGRVRFGGAPQKLYVDSGGPRISISDIALFNRDPSVAANAELNTLASRFLPTTKVNIGSQLGLFWEIYGLRQGEEPRVAVSAISEALVQSRVGKNTRTLPDTIAFATAMSTEFTDLPSQGREIEPRNVSLDISTLRQGAYYLRIVVQVPGEPPAVSIRRIEVR